MERNIKQKIEQNSKQFKDNIKDWLKCCEIVDKEGNKKTKDFLHFVYDFENLNLDDDDFKKRKRVKNIIPNYERCCALRSNKERCTRKKKKNETFCGTHLKGTPNGTIHEDIDEKPIKKVEIWLQEINGVHQYISHEGNVYSTEDINQKINPPRIISTWVKDKNEKYSIK